MKYKYFGFANQTMTVSVGKFFNDTFSRNTCSICAKNISCIHCSHSMAHYGNNTGINFCKIPLRKIVYYFLHFLYIDSSLFQLIKTHVGNYLRNIFFYRSTILFIKSRDIDIGHSMMIIMLFSDVKISIFSINI